MKKLLCTLVPLAALLAGCAVESPQTGDEDAPNAGVDQALTAFEYDTTALTKITPPATIPAAHLTLDKLDELNIAVALLGTTEKPERVDALGGRQAFKTLSWDLEKDSLSGRVLAVSTKESGPAVKLDEPTLQRLALDRLAKFGIGSGEIGRVLQRRGMLQDFDGATPDAPVVQSYKTFVFRAIGGVPVAGHRAVITHGVDGVVRRVLTKWPALAAKGHLMKTALGLADIQARATTALARNGESKGKVFLFWQYKPVVTETGEVTLKLMAGARMRSVTGTDGITEEPRTIDVDVSAL